MFPPASIIQVAQSLGIANLKEEVSQAISQEVEFRIRQVIQTAKAFRRHSHRRRLTVQDLNFALGLKNVQPVYGYHTRQEDLDRGLDHPAFVKVSGPGEVFFVPDETLDIEESLSSPLDRFPVGPKVKVHWLAINGVQPRVPENPVPETIIQRKRRGATTTGEMRQDLEDATRFVVHEPISFGRSGGRSGGSGSGSGSSQEEEEEGETNVGKRRGCGSRSGGGGGGGVLVKHVLSTELQTFYAEVVRIMSNIPDRDDPSSSMTPRSPFKKVKRKNTHLVRAVLRNLSQNISLHQLLPYFLRFINLQICDNFENVAHLALMAEMMNSLIVNPNLSIELYANEFISILLTLALKRKLGDDVDFVEIDFDDDDPNGADQEDEDDEKDEKGDGDVRMRDDDDDLETIRNQLAASIGPVADHWGLRDFAARLLATICHQFGSTYRLLLPKVRNTLGTALLNPQNDLATHYGALRVIAELGTETTHNLLFQPADRPNILLYADFLKDQKAFVETQLDLHQQRAKSRAAGAITEFYLSSGETLTKRQRKEALRIVGQCRRKKRKISRVWTALQSAAALFFSRIRRHFAARDDVFRGSRGDDMRETGEDGDLRMGFSLRQELLNRTILFDTPRFIDRHYKILASLFGEALLPHIDYDIVPASFGPFETVDLVGSFL